MKTESEILEQIWHDIPENIESKLDQKRKLSQLERALQLPIEKPVTWEGTKKELRRDAITQKFVERNIKTDQQLTLVEKIMLQRMAIVRFYSDLIGTETEKPAQYMMYLYPSSYSRRQNLLHNQTIQN